MIGRRDLFRIGGATGTSLLFAHAFGGCADPVAPELPADPDGRWWLSGNYAPVHDEIEAFDLEVEGSLPPELNGLFLRNGANPAADESSHWFTGDGMLHGVRLEGGRALWYRNRFVRTLALETGAPSGLGANVANTSIRAHAGKLLSLYEVAVPYEISPDDLSTVGDYDFGGQLQRPMSAHPKIDPVTGEMFFIGYSPFAPFLTYHVVDASGALTTSVEIDMDHASMMHDFQITESYVLFFDLPIHFDSERLDSGFPFRWAADAPARIGVMARDGSSTEVRWFEVDTCFMFHSFNAYETADGRIVLDGCRMPEIWVNSLSDPTVTPTPWRWELSLNAGTVREDQLHDGSADFPTIDPRRAARDYRMAYSLRFPGGGPREVATPIGINKHDRVSGETQVWESGTGQPDEAIFVSAGEGEDEGYVLSMVFENTTGRSYVAVLDATRVHDGPIARVHMPRRVPFGFHGTWLPSEG